MRTVKVTPRGGVVVMMRPVKVESETRRGRTGWADLMHQLANRPIGTMMTFPIMDIKNPSIRAHCVARHVFGRSGAITVKKTKGFMEVTKIYEPVWSVRA